MDIIKKQYHNNANEKYNYKKNHLQINEDGLILNKID